MRVWEVAESLPNASKYRLIFKLITQTQKHKTNPPFLIHVVRESALIQQKMTVKEKALYLIEKFDIKYYYKFTNGQLPVSMHNQVIKDCVLECVEELIKETSFEVPNIRQRYWIEVKFLIMTEFDQLYRAVP